MEPDGTADEGANSVPNPVTIEPASPDSPVPRADDLLSADKGRRAMDELILSGE